MSNVAAGRQNRLNRALSPLQIIGRLNPEKAKTQTIELGRLLLPRIMRTRTSLRELITLGVQFCLQLGNHAP
jgi:hypothetical protein